MRNFSIQLRTMRQLFLLLILAILTTTGWSQIDSATTGTASYYANKFEGRRTSSGDIFRQDSLTCAHKTLPFGTWLKVTNLSNDSVVYVRVNDRLPKSSKRSIDLTLRSAKQLNFVKKGLTKVKIEVMDRSKYPVQESAEKPE